MEKCFRYGTLVSYYFWLSPTILAQQVMLMRGPIQGNVWNIYLYIWKLCYVQCTPFKYVPSLPQSVAQVTDNSAFKVTLKSL
jgi:hypothetical protein